jgi:hypothetical protein
MESKVSLGRTLVGREMCNCRYKFFGKALIDRVIEIGLSAFIAMLLYCTVRWSHCRSFALKTFRSMDVGAVPLCCIKRKRNLNMTLQNYLHMCLYDESEVAFL